MFLYRYLCIIISNHTVVILIFIEYLSLSLFHFNGYQSFTPPTPSLFIFYNCLLQCFFNFHHRKSILITNNDHHLLSPYHSSYSDSYLLLLSLFIYFSSPAMTVAVAAASHRRVLLSLSLPPSLSDFALYSDK